MTPEEKARRDARRRARMDAEDMEWQNRSRPASKPTPIAADSSNPYAVLGVSPDSSWKEIENSYRKLIFQYHPDRNPNGLEMTKNLNAAFATLKDKHITRLTENIVNLVMSSILS
jgi:DnaJ-class molecular chaperone